MPHGLSAWMVSRWPKGWKNPQIPWSWWHRRVGMFTSKHIFQKQTIYNYHYILIFHPWVGFITIPITFHLSSGNFNYLHVGQPQFAGISRLDGGGLPTARSVAARICLVSPATQGESFEVVLLVDMDGLYRTTSWGSTNMKTGRAPPSKRVKICRNLYKKHVSLVKGKQLWWVVSAACCRLEQPCHTPAYSHEKSLNHYNAAPPSLQTHLTMAITTINPNVKVEWAVHQLSPRAVWREPHSVSTVHTLYR